MNTHFQRSEVAVPCLPVVPPPATDSSFSSCIFCFKRCREVSQNEDEEETPQVIWKRFFNLVDRYFDNRIFSDKSSKTGNGNNVFPERVTFPQDNWKVGCCLDCSTVIKNYCEVYNKIKCLEMELDGMLDKLVNIMKYTDKVPSRISGFRDWCLVEKLDMERSMEFRQKFQKNCKLSTIRSFPRLILRHQISKRSNATESPKDSSPLESPLNLKISSVCSLESQPQTIKPLKEPVLVLPESPAGSPLVPNQTCDSPPDNLDEEPEFPSPPASPEPELTEPDAKRLKLSCSEDHPKESNGNPVKVVDCVDDNDGNDQDKRVELTLSPLLVIPPPPPIISQQFPCFKCFEDPQPEFSSFVQLQAHQNYLHSKGRHKMTKQEFTEVLNLNRQAVKLTGEEIHRQTGALINCCPICQLTFKKEVKKVPLMHLVNYHDLNRRKEPLTCKKASCSAYFLTKDKLKQHLTNVHAPKKVTKKKENKDRDFGCDKCERKFRHLHDLKRHKLLDCGVSKKEVEEYEKIELSSRRGGMNIKDFISGKRKSCPICRKRVNCSKSRKTWIITHYFEYHDKTGLEEEETAGEMSNCKKCKAYFRNAIQLENHLKEIHGEMRNKFECVDCGKTCKDFVKLRLHRKRAHKLDEKGFQFVCDFGECGRKFETELERLYHKRGAHSEGSGMEMCSICGKYFMGSRALKNHMKRHENEDKGEEGDHICEECGKIFESRKKLYAHRKLHEAKNEMKFVCEVCGKVCLNGNKLREHGRTHGKEKPFVCQICGVTYAHGHNLRIHMSKMHGGEEEREFKLKN